MLLCRKALPRGSPETVDAGVTLQLELKTGALTVVIGVIVVIVLGVRFVAGVGVPFTGVLVLLLFVLVAKTCGGGRR